MKNIKKYIIFKYFKSYLSPANRSARGAATNGPIRAISGAIADTMTASSLDRPKAFICRGMKGSRAPMAKNTNGIFKDMFVEVRQQDVRQFHF